VPGKQAFSEALTAGEQDFTQKARENLKMKTHHYVVVKLAGQ